MKGDGESKMNTVEKQCVVHVCSRPAIVGSSQSLTLLGRIFPLDLNSQFIHISPARDMVKPFFIGNTPSVPLQIRAVNIAIHRAKNGSSKRILISPPPSSSRKMPRSIKAPNDLRLLLGVQIECGSAALSAVERDAVVVNEPVDIPAGDQSTPRRHNAWSSQERCGRVTS